MMLSSSEIHGQAQIVIHANLIKLAGMDTLAAENAAYLEALGA